MIKNITPCLVHIAVVNKFGKIMSAFIQVKNDIITNVGNINKLSFSFFLNYKHRQGIPLTIYSGTTPIEIFPTKKCKDNFK